MSKSLTAFTGFRPLIRGFFFYKGLAKVTELKPAGFRPLIRGFFFYQDVFRRSPSGRSTFPSPYSGILFLCVRVEYVYMYFTKKRFPSPYSGILFLFLICVYYATSIVRVSVPLFGDSFFMTLCVRRRTNSLRLVSVPLFGDSFFMKNETFKSDFGSCGFRPLIRGFFFYVFFEN